MKVLGKGFCTQKWDLFPTFLGTDRVLTVLALLAQGTLPERPNHAPDRLPEPPTLHPRVMPLESDSSELEQTGAWQELQEPRALLSLQTTGEHRKAHIRVRPRKEPFHRPILPLPWSPGEGSTCQGSRQEPQGALPRLPEGAPCLPLPRGADRAHASQ